MYTFLLQFIAFAIIANYFSLARHKSTNVSIICSLFPSATVTHVVIRIQFNLKKTITEMSEFDVLTVTILAHNRLNRGEVFFS